MKALLAFAAALALFSASPAPAQTVSEGQRLYEAQGCAQCHGLIGQGALATGPALAPARLDFDAFSAYVRAPKGLMPPYSTRILSEESLQRIHRYLAQIPPGRGAAEIPMLAGLMRPNAASGASRAPRGAALFAQHCALCHGPSGEGAAAVALKGEASKRGRAETVGLIVSPPPAMPKLSPAPLSRADVEAVADYIRTLR